MFRNAARALGARSTGIYPAIRSTVKPSEAVKSSSVRAPVVARLSSTETPGADSPEAAKGGGSRDPGLGTCSLV